MKKMMFLSVFIAALFLAVSSLSAAESPAGKWKTICDETGEAKSIVEIKVENGNLTGTIIELLQEKDDAVCDKCRGKFKDQRIVGMEFIWDMKKDGNEYSGGRILDPGNGREYRCRLWREGDELHVRGFIGISLAGRTQVWQRIGD